ncbi:hypothetical protein BC832DRAFT_595079 [Gaertneriomyces semiglobifer]|nr:hypothetical protein BC832DRAFT_595079 [Gaertneriomyces semiglobifer]
MPSVAIRAATAATTTKRDRRIQRTSCEYLDVSTEDDKTDVYITDQAAFSAFVRRNGVSFVNYQDTGDEWDLIISGNDERCVGRIQAHSAQFMLLNWLYVLDELTSSAHPNVRKIRIGCRHSLAFKLSKLLMDKISSVREGAPCCWPEFYSFFDEATLAGELPAIRECHGEPKLWHVIRDDAGSDRVDALCHVPSTNSHKYSPEYVNILDNRIRLRDLLSLYYCTYHAKRDALPLPPIGSQLRGCLRRAMVQKLCHTLTNGTGHGEHLLRALQWIFSLLGMGPEEDIVRKCRSGTDSAFSRTSSVPGNLDSGVYLIGETMGAPTPLSLASAEFSSVHVRQSIHQSQDPHQIYGLCSDPSDLAEHLDRDLGRDQVSLVEQNIATRPIDTQTLQRAIGGNVIPDEPAHIPGSASHCEVSLPTEQIEQRIYQSHTNSTGEYQVFGQEVQQNIPRTPIPPFPLFHRSHVVIYHWENGEKHNQYFRAYGPWGEAVNGPSPTPFPELHTRYAANTWRLDQRPPQRTRHQCSRTTPCPCQFDNETPNVKFDSEIGLCTRSSAPQMYAMYIRSLEGNVVMGTWRKRPLDAHLDHKMFMESWGKWIEEVFGDAW